MISIGHFSSIVGNKLLCSYQLTNEFSTNNFAVMNVTRQMGKNNDIQYHDSSEILALSSIEPGYRSHIVSIEKSRSNSDVLLKWRSKFKNIKNKLQDPFISELLSIESKLYDQQVVYDETIIIEDFTIDSSRKVADGKHLIYSFFKLNGEILGFRTKRSDEHISEMMSLANKHEIAVYCSEYFIDNSHYRSNKIWHPLLYNNKNNELLLVQESNVNVQITKKVEPTESLKVNQYKHIICPYCDRTFTKRFALTNHIKATHPELLEDYKNAYK